MADDGKSAVRRAFICSGGGLRGCFQVGAIDYLVNTAGIVPDLACGISTGSLQALGLTVGSREHRTDRLLDVWNGLKRESDVYSTPFIDLLWTIPAFLADALHSLITHSEMNGRWRTSLHRLSGLEKKIRANYDPAVIAGSDIRLIVGAVDLESSRLSYFDSRHRGQGAGNDPDYDLRPLDSADLILASCSIPAFFPPVPFGGQQLVDGGVRDIAPLSVAIHTLAAMAEEARDPDPRFELYVLLCYPLGARPSTERRNLLSILLRTIDVMCSEILRDDVETALGINSLLEVHPELSGRYSRFDVYLIEPTRDFIDVLEVDPVKIRAGMEHGRERARIALRAPARLDEHGMITTPV